ncbi:MAG: hypothetical protein GY953_51175, partial [bacterium]|nr:hypothetical protein [bacterium]
LDRVKAVYTETDTRSKRTLLEALADGDLKRPKALARLHDILCFLIAYPDNPEILSLARRMLDGFHQRPDLERLRDDLAGSGIAGTDTPYPFFAPTARWLAQQCPESVSIDWDEFEENELLDQLLYQLALYAESPGIDECPFTIQEWIERLKGPEETDAAFLIRRFASLPLDTFTWETLYNSIGPPLWLSAGDHTPNRTQARLPVKQIAYQTQPLARGRPRMPDAVKERPKAVRRLPARQARELIGIARSMMVATNRELEVFSHASERDVFVADYPQGLSIALLGAIPSQRLLLEAMYGHLILKNGVPVGYGTVSSLFRSSDIAFNIFEPYRGAEAGHTFVKLMAAARHLFGSDSFTLYPYQVGEDNSEAIRSGAWWFYQKLGFRARDAGVVELMNEELRRMKAEPGYRSSAATLRKLATANVFFHLGKVRDDVIGILPASKVGLATTDYLSKRFGSDRGRAAAVCIEEAAKLLGARRPTGKGPRLAWERWAPLVLTMPGVDRWPEGDKRALGEVIDAKGGASELEFVRLFDGHRRLRTAIRRLAGE